MNPIICDSAIRGFKVKKTLTFVRTLYVIVLYDQEMRSGISGFASSFNWKLTDNINNSTFPTQLAGQAGQQDIFLVLNKQHDDKSI
jgi:hypothetical protein